MTTTSKAVAIGAASGVAGFFAMVALFAFVINPWSVNREVKQIMAWNDEGRTDV